jgi:hypothetical protein
MTRTPILDAIALLALTAALATCSGEQAPPAAPPAAKASEVPLPPRTIPAPSASRNPAEVLLAWAEAMSLKQWDAAYLYWENKGAGTGMNIDQFKARWGRLSNPEFEIRPGVSEGAAGSLYYTAPVVLIDGKQRIEGEVVLRRVNDVPGASAEDLRWHVESTTLEF